MSASRKWAWSDPRDGLTREFAGDWLVFGAPGLGRGGPHERLMHRVEQLVKAPLAGMMPTRIGEQGAVEVQWGTRWPLGDAVAAAEDQSISPDSIAQGVIAVCASAGRALSSLAAVGLSAGGLAPHQLGVGADGSVALDVASGWLAATRREALKLSAERLYSAVDDGVLLLELAVSMMSGGAPWAELVARVLDRGRLLDPEARRGGPRVIARVLEELCGEGSPEQQAAHVRAAFPTLGAS